MIDKKASFRGWLPVLLLVLGLATCLQLRAETPDDWKTQSYAYAADNTPLTTVLKDFAEGHGVTLSIDQPLSGEVSAKIRANSASDFLDRLALEHHFQWFVYNNKLYVSPQDAQTSERLEISPDSAPDIKQALKGIGLLDSRFGWGEMPDDGVVLVTGPPQYVDLIKNFSKKSQKKDDRRKVMMFPLHYASVADRNLQYRGETLTIPGVATILSELMDGKSAPQSAKGSSTQNVSNAFQPMQNSTSELLKRLSANDSASNSHRSSSSSYSLDDDDNLSGKISADVRNNALLIRDDEKRHDEYQQLVDRIDIPQNLVEIDAVIMDIDRSALNRLEANWQATFGGVTGGSSMMSGNGTLMISDFKRFFADVQALEGEGVASVIANPSVLTLENQPAIIDFSQTAFITATGERVANIEPVTAGTSVQVTPRALGQGNSASIQLLIDIEDGHVQTDNNGVASGVKRGNVSTQALVAVNRSLVLGGFHVEESGDRDKRIPILGDIPLLGRLFTSTRHEISQRERLFILTPHLVGDQTDPTRYVAEENRQQVSDAMSRIANRHTSASTHDLIENAFRDLAENQAPSGFSQQNFGDRLNFVCHSTPSLRFNTTRGQWYQHDNLLLSIGVVRNISSISRRFDESNCGGDHTLAVSAWPHSKLAPGESAEVFVALDKSQSLKPSRLSLLTQ